MSQLADSASMHRWTEIYGEYAAFGRLFRAMSKLRSISDKSVSTLVYHQNEIQEIFTELRLVLSYREHHLDENLAKLATQRQSSAVNLFLALFSCFSTDFLLGPIVPSPDEALNDYLRTHDQGVLCKVQLPTFRSADFIWDENVQGTLKTTLTWVTDNLTKMHNAAVSQDIPDLASFVNCSAWHFQDGSIRTLLRSTFPRLPESRQHKNDKTVRRPNPTIADMEAFLLILLVQRHMWAISKMGVTTLGEITLTCALGTWRPTAQQERFWRTALWLHGKKLWGSQCAALGTMEDENYYGCIQEIRGNITYSSKGSRDSHAYHRNIWGALGLLYSETLNRSSSDRYAEARDYLTCWKDWPNSPLIERSTRNFHILPEADQWERFAITEQEIDNALILADGNHDKSFSEPPSHQSPSRVMEEMRALRAISKSISSPYGNARGSLPNSPLTSTSRKTSDISLTSSTDAAPLKDVGAATVDPSFRQMESQDLDMSAISMSDSILAQGSDILSDFDIEPVEEASGECTPTLAFQSARTHRHLQMLTDLRRGDFKDPSFTPTAIPRAAKPPHPFHSRLPISPRTTENKLDVPPELPRSPFSNPGSAGRPTLPRSLVQTQSSPSPIPTLPSTLPSSLMSSPSRSPRLRKQDTTSTPKRDPLELRGGRGDLSELRKRAVVARSLNLFGPSSHKPLAEQSSNAQQKQPEMSARLARQMRVLEQLRAQA
ncbi:hypothetical protein DFS34DRAFT_140345 [Phlyctochytrium arcticum]|nr:hypothetical protein DFS34DRAFT_140345 [Phlyctochytrium arcticum]